MADVNVGPGFGAGDAGVAEAGRVLALEAHAALASAQTCIGSYDVPPSKVLDPVVEACQEGNEQGESN